MANLSINPYLMIYDDNGVTCPGAKIWTYAAGTTSTPKATYTDYASEIEASNPVIADAGGRVALWLATDGLYKLVITDQYDNAIYTQDNVGTGAGGGTSAVVSTVVGGTDSLKALGDAAATAVTALGYWSLGDGGGGTFYWADSATGGDDGAVVNGNVSYTTGRWKRIIEGDCNARWWGAYGNSTDDDTQYITNAIAFCNEQGKSLVLTEGTYSLESSVDFLDIPVKFDPNASFAWTNFSPDLIAVIQPGDLTQHFRVGTSTDYVPKFPSGSTARPEHFGAVADGATDDVNAINQAIKAVSYTGGIVVLDGAYAVSSDIIILDNIALRGIGSITATADYSGTALIGVDLGTNPSGAYNVLIKDLTLDGNNKNVNGILISGNYNTIDNCKISNCNYGGIGVGKYGNITSQSYVTITNNTIVDNGTSSIDVEYGDHITIGNNIADNVIVVSGIHPIEDVLIHDNIVAGVQIYSDDIKDISVRDNTITGQISVENTATIAGKLVFDGNDVTDSTTGINVHLNNQAGIDQVVVSNNNIAGTSTGIILDSIASKTYVHGNTINGSTDSTGIREVGPVTDATYGTNMFYNVNDWYDVSEPRYCTLGTALRSQIDGDTTNDYNMSIGGNASVAGNLTVGLNIVNTALTNILRANIYGLETTWDASSTIGITRGTCNTSLPNGDFYTTNVTTKIKKNLLKTWVEGDTSGGRASSLPAPNSPAIYQWYHVFLLGKSTSVGSYDAGFDTDLNATNLLTDTAGSGYDTYRRVGSVLWELSGIMPYYQIGDNFITGSSNQTSFDQTTAATVSWNWRLGPPDGTTASVPPGYPVRANLAGQFQTNTGSNAYVEFGDYGSDANFGVLNTGASGPANVAGTTQVIVWTDSTQTISATSNGGGDSDFPIYLTVMGWEDPRGKYQRGV